MKRKIFSVFFALVLALSLSFVTAVPAPVAADEGTNYSPFGTVAYLFGADHSSAYEVKWFFSTDSGNQWDGWPITLVAMDPDWSSDWNGNWYLKNTGTNQYFELYADYDGENFSNPLSTSPNGFIGMFTGPPYAYFINDHVDFDPAIDTIGVDPREIVGELSHMFYDRFDAGSGGGNLEVKLNTFGEPDSFHGRYLDLVECGWDNLNGGWFLKYVLSAGSTSGWYELYADAEFTQPGIPEDPGKFVGDPYKGDLGYLFELSGWFVLPYEVWVDDEGADSNAGTENLPFATIQKGIDMVASGGTVNVAAGTYIGVVIINKSLTLEGAQAGEDARTRSGDESVIDGGSTTANYYLVQIKADNVIFDGFTVTHPQFTGSADASGILTHIGGPWSNIRITNCIIHDIGAPTRTSVAFGAFAINSGPVNGLEIDHNLMYNLKHSDETDSWANAIIVWGNSPTVLASNVNIHDNKMYDIESPASPATATKLYDGGIFISSDCENVTIDNNDFTNCGEYGISTNIGTGSDVTITNNMISGATVAGIRCMDKADTITGNTISGCGAGIQVRSEATAAPTVHLNNISGNTIGLENNTGFTVDATNNWWGMVNGPTHEDNTFNVGEQGNAVSDLVDFVPWLDAAYDIGTSFAPVENIDAEEQFSSIQTAIDDPSVEDGDTITVAAGTYVEAVKVDEQGLVLKGANAGIPSTGTRGSESIIKPDNTTPTHDGNRRVAVKVEQVDGVTIDGFEIDGTGGIVHCGIYPFNSNNTTVKNNVVHDITNTIDAPGSDVAGLGILFFGWEQGIDYATIESNTVYNTGRMGIIICSATGSYGPYIVCSNNVIKNNTVYNAWQGPTNTENPDKVDNGGAIQINGAKNSLIEGNTVYDTGLDLYGIYIFGSVSSTPNSIVGNDVSSNNVGIAIWSNPEGNVTYGIDEPPGAPKAHFNNIYTNTTGLMVVDTDLIYEVDATNNWWGTKASGLIKNMVSGNVDYDPWIGAKTKDSKSKKTKEGVDTVDAKDKTDTDVVKKGNGKPTITVTEYTENPGDGTPGGFSSVGDKYIDVHLDDTTDVEEIEIRNYYTPADIAGLNEATLKLSWWNGTDWIECSDSGATYPAGEPTYRGYVWAIIKAPGAIPPTIPTLDDMAGTAFMSMGKPPAPTPAPPPPEPEEEAEVGVGPAAPPAPPPGTTNVKGKVSSTGVFNEKVTATSEDELCTLTIPRGTVGLTEDLEPLTRITALIMDEPPPPSEDAHIVGLAYDFCPDGATFEPAISLTWSYDPADIPEGVAEEDLVIAYYDEAAGEWVELVCVVDAENSTITASVSHFTTFVIIGAVTPPPPPPVPPAPAGFSLSNLTVQPAEVQPNETVTIAVSVANTGGIEGSYTVVLKINGVKVEESRVTIAAGSSQIVRFFTSSEEVGRYNVTVDGLSVSFAVVAPVVAPVVPPTEPEEVEEVPAERNWPLIIISGIIAAAVMIGLVAFFLVRRRA